MGTGRARQKQEELFYASERAEAPGHPFYQRLNRVLNEAGFDAFCEERCRDFYHTKLGRPSLAPGVYFRLLLIGFFEGIESERGIGWRVADSLSLRRFLNYGLDEATPDHVTISRTRRLLDEATHQAVFRFVLTEVARRGLLRGKTIGIDATTLEANAAMRSIVRRDTGESYMEYLRRLAVEAGIDGADDEAVRRMDRKRKKRTSNEESSVPRQPRRNWEGKAEQQAAVYANRRRVEGERGKSLLRRRGEFLERPFAHQYETGAMRRLHVRGRDNVAKRVLLQAAAFNLALILRTMTKAGTPRALADLERRLFCALWRVLAASVTTLRARLPASEDFGHQPLRSATLSPDPPKCSHCRKREF